MTSKDICELRTKLLLTQEEFAKVLKVSYSTVQKWEQGKTKPSFKYERLLRLLKEVE